MIKNMASNAVYLILNISIGLILVPYFLDTLGKDAWGIITLSSSLTTYVVLISNSLAASTSRYMAISLQRGDQSDSVRTYNTTIFGLAKVILIMVPIIILIALISPYVFDTGSVLSVDVQIMFMCTLASVLISSWGSSFQTVLLSRNRIDYQNIVRTSQIVIQVCIIVMSFTLFEPSLVLVGAAYLAASILSTAIGYVLTRRTCPFLKVNKKEFDKAHFKEMGGLGVWTMVHNIGSLLLIQTSVLLTNILLGPSIGGEFGMVVSIILVLSSVGGIVSTVFTPITYNNFSKGRIDDMIRICRSAVKVVGIVFSLPLAFICVFSPQIFTVWVGEGYVHLESIVWITLSLFVVFEAVHPLDPIAMSYLKARVPGIATVLFGLTNITLIFVFVYFLDFGLTGIALAWTISMFGKYGIFTPWYQARISNQKWHIFFVPLLYGFGCFIISAVFCSAVNLVVSIPPSLIALIIVALFVFVVYIFTIPNILLNKDEKNLVRSCLPNFITSRLPKWFL